MDPETNPAAALSEPEREQRIVEARLKLRERFLARMEATPGVADARPLGTGPTNRHGMPKLPVGQTASRKWPVLDLGRPVRVVRERWRLAVDGAVDHPLDLSIEDLLALPQVDVVSDFHCVTGWSRMDLAWRGVLASTLLERAAPKAAASHLLVHGYDGYTTNLPLEEALKPDVLVAHTVDGAPLPREHGGPVRMVTPQLYAWKGAKWISRIEVLTHDEPGLWEKNGYSNTAHPWRNDRYDR